MNASLALVQPEYADFGKCQMLMFLVNVNLCLYFVLWRVCVCMCVSVCASVGVCVSCMTCSVCL